MWAWLRFSARYDALHGREALVAGLATSVATIAAGGEGFTAFDFAVPVLAMRTGRLRLSLSSQYTLPVLVSA
jgi:hypothetical protein